MRVLATVGSYGALSFAVGLATSHTGRSYLFKGSYYVSAGEMCDGQWKLERAVAAHLEGLEQLLLLAGVYPGATRTRSSRDRPGAHLAGLAQDHFYCLPNEVKNWFHGRKMQRSFCA